jgi:hypothetical protein
MTDGRHNAAVGRRIGRDRARNHWGPNLDWTLAGQSQMALFKFPEITGFISKNDMDALPYQGVRSSGIVI